MLLRRVPCHASAFPLSKWIQKPRAVCTVSLRRQQCTCPPEPAPIPHFAVLHNVDTATPVVQVSASAHAHGSHAWDAAEAAIHAAKAKAKASPNGRLRLDLTDSFIGDDDYMPEDVECAVPQLVELGVDVIMLMDDPCSTSVGGDDVALALDALLDDDQLTTPATWPLEERIGLRAQPSSIDVDVGEVEARVAVAKKALERAGGGDDPHAVSTAEQRLHAALLAWQDALRTKRGDGELRPSPFRWQDQVRAAVRLRVRHYDYCPTGLKAPQLHLLAGLLHDLGVQHEHAPSKRQQLISEYKDTVLGIRPLADLELEYERCFGCHPPFAGHAYQRRHAMRVALVDLHVSQVLNARP